MQNFLLAQTLLILVGVVFSYYFTNEFGAISAAYGGGVALFSSLILARRAHRAFESASKGTGSIMVLLYAGVIQRYAFVLLGLGIGLGLLKFKVEPLLAVFGVAQLAYCIPWLGNE